MRWFLAVALVALAACTPPRTELEDSQVGDAEARVPEKRPPSKGMGLAAAPAGFLFFSSNQEMYRALGDLVAGTVARGSSSSSLDFSDDQLSDEERAALDQIAERSARASARAAGNRLLAAQVQLEPLPDGTHRARVTADVLHPSGQVRTQLREGVIVKGQVIWTTPPLEVSREEELSSPRGGAR